jgi:hypothetical protein
VAVLTWRSTLQSTPSQRQSTPRTFDDDHDYDNDNDNDDNDDDETTVSEVAPFET